MTNEILADSKQEDVAEMAEERRWRFLGCGTVTEEASISF